MLKYDKIMDMEPRKYQFNNSSLTVVFGDILTSKAEVIVCPDDTNISMSNDISAGILKAGGESVRCDAQKKLPAHIGDIIVSSAGMMKQKYIFHCLIIDHENNELVGERVLSEPKNAGNVIRNTIMKCFHLVEALNLKSIAFPSFEIGMTHNSLKDAVEMMIDGILIQIYKKKIQCDIELYVCNLGERDESICQDIINVLDLKKQICYTVILGWLGLGSNPLILQL